MSFRMDRLNSEMQKSLADIFNNRVKDPRITELVSVLEVNVAKDLKTAKVYLSIYGDKEKIPSTFNAIVKMASFIRHELAIDFKNIRTVPELTFILDNSMEYSQHIESILEKIKNKD